MLVRKRFAYIPNVDKYCLVMFICSILFFNNAGKADPSSSFPSFFVSLSYLRVLSSVDVKSFKSCEFAFSVL